MKRFALLLVAVCLVPLSSVFADTTYTWEEIQQHDSASDCYMVFEETVYDFTTYPNSHDRYMDIRDWCGQDMTEDFMTKAGLDRDHKPSSYAMLDAYVIGTLSTEPAPTLTPTPIPSTITESSDEPLLEEEHESEYSVEISGSELKARTISDIAELWGIDPEQLLEETINTFTLINVYTINSTVDDLRSEHTFAPSQIKAIAESILNPSLTAPTSTPAPTTDKPSPASPKPSMPYNFFVPFFLSSFLYLLHWKLSTTSLGKKYKIFSRPGFKWTWNTVLLIALIPSAVFGFYLIFQYRFPALRNVDFDFLYWHVEGSIVFTTVVVLHFISRLGQYSGQFKYLNK